jgi:probable rRNA maturation factor
MAPTIRFFSEGIKFRLTKKNKTAEWLRKVADAENRPIASLNIIFCSDSYLATMNLEYLKHKTLTDIITFDLDPNASEVNGEIYISKDRVEENAYQFRVPFDSELHRVMVHGLLHLTGNSDKGARQKAAMRKKEDAYLSLRT